MDIRPRCREWLALSTQQLRLRNLQAIQGINIEYNGRESSEALLYYTLHERLEGEKFYQSEPLPQRKHFQQKWAEITCSTMLKSNANCVCVKVWALVEKTENILNDQRHPQPEASEEPTSALTREFGKVNQLPNRAPDELLFTWGVYFSGLIPLSQQADVRCCPNSLIFQMNGEYFASPEHFTTESLREQLALNYQRYSSSVPKCSIPTPDEFSINSPQVSRSSSPVPIDWQRDLLRMSKTRYAQLNWARSDVRKSYSLDQLLRLQFLQRQRLQTVRESVELTARIKQLSLYCITKEQLMQKSRATSLSSSLAVSPSTSVAAYHHSMGRTLSMLLAEQQRLDPYQLLRAQQLERQTESLRCKQRLLQDAYQAYSKRILQMRQQLAATTTSRQKLQTWLAKRYHKLDADKTNMKKSYEEHLAQMQRKRSIEQHVERRMSALCVELREIYPLSRNNNGLHTICGIPIPLMEFYVHDARYGNSMSLAEHISPMALSAALGYVAHLVQMISVIINRPLRNPIVHEGSRTRIMDIIKDIPYASREYPLYSRSAIPTNPVKYAIYLLNQNIAQLCYDITGRRCDVRSTVENLVHIFDTLAEIEKTHCEIDGENCTRTNNRFIRRENNHMASNCHSPDIHHRFAENGVDDSLSKSHSSVDMNVPPPNTPHVPALCLAKEKFLLPTGSSQPIAIMKRVNSTSQRVCRSVGSYSDNEDDFKCPIDHSYSNSDSNLTLQSDHI